jgi:hypothetical protein
MKTAVENGLEELLQKVIGSVYVSELLEKKVEDFLGKPVLVLVFEVLEVYFSEEVLDEMDLMINDGVGEEGMVALVPAFEQLVVEVRVDSLHHHLVAELLGPQVVDQVVPETYYRVHLAPVIN